MMYSCNNCHELFQTEPAADGSVICPNCNHYVVAPNNQEAAPVPQAPVETEAPAQAPIAVEIEETYEEVDEEEPEVAVNNPAGDEDIMEYDVDAVLENGTVIGGFLILNLLGQGGMGNVYLANQQSMNREVALKVLPDSMTWDRDAINKFLHEVKMSGQISHPNIVTAIDAGEEDGTYYLAMTYVDGEALEDRQEREEIIPEKEILGYAVKIAEALEYVWKQHGMIHKDIKPGNIMINQAGEAFLLDMGIAQRITDQHQKQEHIEGSPFYMSPEQSRMKELDWRTDMYSLGASMYHLMVGVPAYDSKDVYEIIEMHNKAKFPDPKKRNPESDLAPSTIEILRKMMAKKPEDRYSSWTAFRKAASRTIKQGDREKKAAALKQSVIEARKKRAGTAPPKRKIPVFLLMNTFLMIGTAAGIAYYWLKINNDAGAKDAVAKAESFISSSKFDEANNDKVLEALDYFQEAREKTDKFGVDEKYRKRAQNGYKKLKLIANKQRKVDEVFSQALANCTEAYEEANFFFKQTLVNYKKTKKDKGMLAKTEEQHRKALQFLAGATAETDLQKQQVKLMMGKLLALKKRMTAHVEKVERIAEREEEKKQEEEEAKREAEEMAEEKKENLANYKTEIAKTMDRMRLQLILNCKRRDFMVAERDAKVDKEAEKVDYDYLKEDAEAFDGWVSDSLLPSMKASEKIWESLCNSHKTLAGETINVGTTKWVIARIVEGDLHLEKGSDEGKKISINDLSNEDLAPLINKIGAERGGNEVLAKYYMTTGDFVRAKKLAEEDDTKKEISAFTSVYLRARMLKHFKRKKAKKKSSLKSLRKSYGKLPEYKKVYSEIKKKFAKEKSEEEEE